MKAAFIISALLVCLFGASLATVPGVKVAITPSAFNDFLKDYAPRLLTKLGTISIPSVSQSDIKVTNMVLKDMYLSGNDVSVTFIENQGSFQTTNFGFSLDFHVDYKLFGLIPFSLQLGGSSNKSQLLFNVTFSYNDEYVQVTVNTFAFNIHNMDLHFPSGIGFDILHAITGVFQGPLENLISSVIGSTMKSVLQQGINLGLTKVPGFGPIPGTSLGVDYEAVQAPKINPTYLTTYLNGTFYNTKKNFTVPPIPESSDYPEFDGTTDHDIQIFISQYLLNTALYALWDSDIMNVNITNSMIPAQAGLQINVGWMSQFIPNLTNYYNDTSLDMLTGVTVKSAPTLNITEGDIQASADLILTFWALNGSEPAKVVSVEATLQFDANFTIANWSVAPFIIGGSFGDFSIIESQVGSFDPATFKQGLNILLMFALPGFNAASPVFALPKIPQIDLEATTVQIGNNYIEVGAYPHYTEESVANSAKQMKTLFDKHYEMIMAKAV